MSILAAYMVPHPPMIVPAVGRGSEKQIEKTTRAYEQVADEIASLQPDTIIITSPHSVMYSDYFHISPGKRARGDFGQFRASQVSFEEEYDTELVSAIAELARKVIALTGSRSEIEFIPYEKAYAPGFQDMMRRKPSVEKVLARTVLFSRKIRSLS